MVDDAGVGLAQRLLRHAPLLRPARHVIRDAAGLHILDNAKFVALALSTVRMLRLRSTDRACLRPPVPAPPPCASHSTPGPTRSRPQASPASSPRRSPPAPPSAPNLIGLLAVLRLTPSPLDCLSGRSSTFSARRPRLWTGHAELSELGVARFARYLTHNRKESTLKAYGPGCPDPSTEPARPGQPNRPTRRRTPA